MLKWRRSTGSTGHSSLAGHKTHQNLQNEELKNPFQKLSPKRRGKEGISGKCLIIWRPRRDLNSCYRRERPVSWARLDDGDMVGHAGFEPAALCLKVSAGRQTKSHTLLKLAGFSRYPSGKSEFHRTYFGECHGPKTDRAKTVLF